LGAGIWKVAKRTLLGLLVVLVTVIGSGTIYRVYRHRQITLATPVDPVRGIDEEVFATIGGVEQWISIRGQNRDNPVLLLVHGGPGFATSFLGRDFLYTWTRDFTLVRWDQRGAGRTYGRSGALGPGITIDRMAQDGIEVAEFLRSKLRKPKVVLVGLSWGSMLGVKMAKARPELFYAYVGTGQAVNQYKYKKIAYDLILAEARRRNDRKAIRQLEENGPPPYETGRREGVHTKWANAFEPGQPSLWEGVSLVLFDGVDGPLDLANFVRGLLDSDDYFREEQKTLDLPSLGTDFPLPFFVFQGAVDMVTPVPPVQDYVERIRAPRKELVLIPNTGHNVMATNSDEFLKLLIDRVRPLAR
jgi:pimeloyl-ACP methyl ester carboxylesterase